MQGLSLNLCDMIVVVVGRLMSIYLVLAIGNFIWVYWCWTEVADGSRYIFLI